MGRGEGVEHKVGELRVASPRHYSRISTLTAVLSWSSELTNNREGGGELSKYCEGQTRGAGCNRKDFAK